VDVIIDLTPSEEAQLSAAAKQSGLGPAEFVKKLVTERLPAAAATGGDDLDSNLRELREQDGVKLGPDTPTLQLFAQWADEDSQLTNEQREENDRIYAEIESNGIPRAQFT
jgi:hypothetical protein